MRSPARVLLTLLVLASFALGRAEAQQSAEYKTLREKVAEVQKQVSAKKDKEAAEALAAAETALAAAKAKETSAAGKKAVAGQETTLMALKKNIDAKKPAGAPAKPATGAPATPPAGGAGGVSFMKDVAPMLANKCGNCHMGGAMRGEFSMTSFDALMKGVKGASVIDAGKGKTSRLVEIIESGDMPRGGGKVSAMELASLTKWIDEGAKFDGPNRTAPLRALGGPRETVALAMATGNEKIKFSRDIAPILVANCIGCHGGQNAPRNLSLDSFQDILRGGQGGVVIAPGKGNESLLIKKLRGTSGDGARMPLRKDPLSEDVIGKVELWINEGAKFDGESPTMPTKTVAEIYEAKTMSHEQLAERREKLATANWKLGNPDVEFAQIETDHFLIIGNTVKSRLDEVAKIAEEQYDKVGKLFQVTDEKPLVKGKLTLFVFNRHFQYAEYGTMVEQRSLPKDWRGHWRFSIIDAYACIAPPKEEEDSMDRLLGELLVGCYIDSLGKVPGWFAQGAARAVSAKFAPKSPAVLSWDARIPTTLQEVGDPGALLEGKMDASSGSVVAYGFCKALVGRTQNYNALLKNLKEGKSFDDAFGAAYGSEPAPLLKSWAAGARTAKRR